MKAGTSPTAKTYPARGGASRILCPGVTETFIGSALAVRASAELVRATSWKPMTARPSGSNYLRVLERPADRAVPADGVQSSGVLRNLGIFTRLGGRMLRCFIFFGAIAYWLSPFSPLPGIADGKEIVGSGGGNPPSADCIYITALHQTLPKKDFDNFIREKTQEGWTRERSVSAGYGHFGRIWLCPPPSDQPASVQALPVLPLFNFGLGFGHRDHGDDPYRK